MALMIINNYYRIVGLAIPDLITAKHRGFWHIQSVTGIFIMWQGSILNKFSLVIYCSVYDLLLNLLLLPLFVS